MPNFAPKKSLVPRTDDPARPSRIVSGAVIDDDARLDASVRPKRLDEYIGQKRVKENISIAIEAARSRGEALDHVLLYGPPGLGKTTLAQIIANELNVPIKTSAGPLLERKGDLTAILTALEKKEVFFLDEIHRLQAAVEEVLYPAMEDFRVDLVIGQGPGARIHPFHLNHFTLIGATTRAGLITAPLRSRFGIVHRLDFYTPEDLLIILHRSAKILNIQMDEGGAVEIAGRCRGTPRVANRLLRRARDFAEVRADGRITREVAQDSLRMLGVDEHGLDEVDRNLLLALLDKYNGGPVGLGTLAAALSEEEDVIEEMYEPYLMQIGMLDRTPRGRVATPRAYEYFQPRCFPSASPAFSDLFPPLRTLSSRYAGLFFTRTQNSLDTGPPDQYYPRHSAVPFHPRRQSMARRQFLAQLMGLPFLSFGVKAEEPKKILKIMMKSAWGSDDPTKAAFPFHHGLALAEAGHEVQIFLLGEATSLMRKATANAVVPVGWPPLSEALEKIAAKHIPVFSCGVCSRARGVTENDLAQWGAKFGSPAIFVGLVEWADRIITE